MVTFDFMCLEHAPDLSHMTHCLLKPLTGPKRFIQVFKKAMNKINPHFINKNNLKLNLTTINLSISSIRYLSLPD